MTQALLTLNSCPMFTWAERDLHRMPTPAKSHLPIKEFIASSGILDDENTSSHSSDADVALLRLPAPSLRGTFAKAYVLLAKLVSLVGWDELLKCRSQVFVMEEEYRAHRAADGPSESPLVPNGGTESASGTDETEGPGPLALATDDEASEKAPSVKEAEEEEENQSEAVPSIPTIAVNGQTEDGQQIDGDDSSAAEIPTIKVSTESDGEREREELKRFEESEAGRKAREVVGKPNQARQASEEDGEAGSNAAADAVATSEGKSSSSPTIQNKRLCERWLDNLFMVLYEVGLHSSSSSATRRRLIRFSSTGPANLYHLAGRSRALQGAALAVPQDGDRVGDPRRARAATAPPRGSQGRVPARAGPKVLGQGVAQAARDLRRRRRRAAEFERCDPLERVPAPVVHGAIGAFATAVIDLSMTRRG
jgi:hypothetical protein